MKIQKELANSDIIIAGVALERNNTKDKYAKVENFHTSNKMNYINFVDVDNKLNAAYKGGIESLYNSINSPKIYIT
jgi:hypothetical protein